VEVLFEVVVVVVVVRGGGVGLLTKLFRTLQE
jgi:hypothetical protein